MLIYDGVQKLFKKCTQHSKIKGIESKLLKQEEGRKRVQWAELCHSLSGGGLQNQREGARGEQLETPEIRDGLYVCARALEEDNSHRIALRTILENILPFLAGLGLCSNAATGR